MKLTKPELRRQLKETRLTLTDAEHTIISRQIVANLKAALDWSKVLTVHYFEPIHELLEPDISGLVTHLEDTYTHIKLYAPRLIAGEWQMVSIQEEAPPSEFDVIIVPMLGFDNALHRIGYGGGYYDKFLATQPGAKKIGACFDLGRLDQPIPAEPYDISLDTIITETHTYKK